tara:strand:- start:67 stop:261 length:195 start_codon:yes stop_codon:yes gene_type:complete
MTIENKSKWRNITIRRASYEELQNIQKLMPIRASIPQVIEWLIGAGRKQIIKSDNKKNTNLNVL